jgi:polyphenol oxidase
MGFVYQKGLRYYQFDLFLDQPIFHAVLTRQGGVSQPPYDSLNTGGTVGDDPASVLVNHQRIYKILDYPFDSRFDVWQVHGTRILTAQAPRPIDKPHPKADGILTDQSGITLFMRFADCTPILLYDPIRRVIGIVHAGWQGTCQKIASAAVGRMTQAYGSKPEDILAGIGPSICQACYEVGEEVFQAYQESFGPEAGKLFHREEGKWFLDLWRANQVVLKEVGVRQIETAGICTACNLQDWYSHRAEQGKTGRFGVLMALKE